MTTEKRTNWMAWLAIACASISVYMCWCGLDQRAELANRDANDSILFKDARALYIRGMQVRDSLQEELNKSEGLRASERVYHEQREKAYQAENNRLRRQLANVNTSTATTQQLDSIHRSLYGQAPDDSTHTIALEYSRQLTGDALRLPIVERMLTNTEQELDDWKGHYTRMEGSYRVDLETADQVIKAEEETNQGLMNTVGKMQGEINEQDLAFRRQRRRERVLYVVTVVGILILAL